MRHDLYSPWRRARIGLYFTHTNNKHKPSISTIASDTELRIQKANNNFQTNITPPRSYTVLAKSAFEHPGTTFPALTDFRYANMFCRRHMLSHQFQELAEPDIVLVSLLQPSSSLIPPAYPSASYMDRTVLGEEKPLAWMRHVTLRTISAYGERACTTTHVTWARRRAHQ